MTIEVMNRVENKYLIDTYVCARLMKAVEKYMKLDVYNEQQDFYTISNIYYDTDDNHLIRTSLSKPKYKEKLRLRAYGVPKVTDSVFMEVKKKCRGIVNKRRAAFTLPKAYEFAETLRAPQTDIRNKQIVKELEYALNFYQPKPKVYIAYDRRAYFGDGGLRVTFDTNIRTRRYDLRLENGDYGELLLDGGEVLMETKVNGALPMWLARTLSEFKVYSGSFSKYGEEYKQFLMNGGVVNCLNQSLAQERTPAQPSQSHGRILLPQYA